MKNIDTSKNLVSPYYTVKPFIMTSYVNIGNLASEKEVEKFCMKVLRKLEKNKLSGQINYVVPTRGEGHIEFFEVPVDFTQALAEL